MAVPFRELMTQPVSNSSVELFRIAFGWLVAIEMAFVWQADLVSQSYRAEIRVPVPGWGWLPQISGAGSDIHLLLIGIAGLSAAAGWWARFNLWAICLLLFNLLVLDQSAYLNHHYLMALLAGALGAMPIGRRWQLFLHTRSLTIPLSCLWTLRFLMALPYFFGGLAKLDADWLQGEPLGFWLKSKAHLPMLGPVFSHPSAITASCIGSMLLDLLAPFLLLLRPTRMIAFGVLLIFHLLNALLWDIGAFPWLMIFGSTLFFEPDWIDCLLNVKSSVPVTAQCWPTTVWGRAVLMLFILLQIVIPTRHWFYPGNVRWTGEGACFSWLMMHKRVEGAVIFEVVNPATNERLVVDPATVLSPRQLATLPGNLDLIRATALALAESVQDQSGFRPRVFARSLVSLNGRTPQPIVSDSLDLANPNLRETANRVIVVPLRSKEFEPQNGTEITEKKNGELNRE